MEQAPPTGPTPTNPGKKKKKEEGGPPTAEEILAHYESQGLETKEASLRAISDLQSLFFRAVSSNRSSTTTIGRKLDSINTRLAIVEMKLDSKPGAPQSFAIGLASASLLSAVPHLARIWDSVKSATNSSTSS